MQSKEISEGNCFVCGATLDKIKMKNHVVKMHELAEEASKQKSEKAFLVKAEGAYDKNYWLYLDIAADSELYELDSFLRKIWLECCGHMSAFYLNRHDDIDMNTKICSLTPGSKLLYQYDFGSTTDLVITILADVRREMQEHPVRLLARNIPTEFKCTKCGKPAEYISPEWGEDGSIYYCAKCSKKHEDDGILPIINSPRMGECGYCGELDTYTFDPALFEKKQNTSLR
jgi:DNA-directed RNA polymerase subunit RPC12/RpoP